MKREDARELEHVALSVAVAVVVYKLSGEQVGGTRSPEALRLFNDVAHAMAHIVPIYTLRPNGLPKELGHMEVVQGRFEHGAIFSAPSTAPTTTSSPSSVATSRKRPKCSRR